MPGDEPLLTVGHGTLSAAAFLALLHGARVVRIVDVRSVPKSRHNPQFSRENVGAWLWEGGIAYDWEPRLGGFRHSRSAASPNRSLRHASFRSYADYMLTDEFANARDELLAGSRRERIAIMCSETLWWRCHRRLIADNVVLVLSRVVEHLMHDGTLEPHRLTEGVRGGGTVVFYDG